MRMGQIRSTSKTNLWEGGKSDRLFARSLSLECGTVPIRYHLRARGGSAASDCLCVRCPARTHVCLHQPTAKDIGNPPRGPSRAPRPTQTGSWLGLPRQSPARPANAQPDPHQCQPGESTGQQCNKTSVKRKPPLGIQHKSRGHLELARAAPRAHPGLSGLFRGFLSLEPRLVRRNRLSVGDELG